MSVNEYARREAEKRWPTNRTAEPRALNTQRIKHEAGVDLVTHAFDALLSDKAVEAARVALAARGFDVWESGAKIAIQAAIAAITEEEA